VDNLSRIKKTSSLCLETPVSQISLFDESLKVLDDGLHFLFCNRKCRLRAVNVIASLHSVLAQPFHREMLPNDPDGNPEIRTTVDSTFVPSGNANSFLSGIETTDCFNYEDSSIDVSNLSGIIVADTVARREGAL
jgi:hypothetical protein